MIPSQWTLYSMDWIVSTRSPDPTQSALPLGCSEPEVSFALSVSRASAKRTTVVSTSSKKVPINWPAIMSH